MLYRSDNRGTTWSHAGELPSIWAGAYMTNLSSSGKLYIAGWYGAGPPHKVGVVSYDPATGAIAGPIEVANDARRHPGTRASAGSEGISRVTETTSGDVVRVHNTFKAANGDFGVVVRRVRINGATVTQFNNRGRCSPRTRQHPEVATASRAGCRRASGWRGDVTSPGAYDFRTACKLDQRCRRTQSERREVSIRLDDVGTLRHRRLPWRRRLQWTPAGASALMRCDDRRRQNGGMKGGPLVRRVLPACLFALACSRLIGEDFDVEERDCSGCGVASAAPSVLAGTGNAGRSGDGGESGINSGSHGGISGAGALGAAGHGGVNSDQHSGAAGEPQLNGGGQDFGGRGGRTSDGGGPLGGFAGDTQSGGTGETVEGQGGESGGSAGGSAEDPLLPTCTSTGGLTLLPFGAPAVALAVGAPYGWYDRFLQVYTVRTGDNLVGVAFEDSRLGPGSWTSWICFDALPRPTRITSSTMSNGMAEVFATTADGGLHVRRQFSFDWGGWWPSDPPSAGSQVDDVYSVGAPGVRTRLYVTDRGRVYSRQKTSDDAYSPYSPWRNLGAEGAWRVAAGTGYDSSEWVVALDRDGVLRTRRDPELPDAENWSVLPTDGEAKDIECGRTSDGRLIVYALVGSGDIARAEELTDGTFASWVTVKQAADPPAVVSMTIGRRAGEDVMIVLSDSGAVFYLTSSGSWEPIPGP